MVSAWFPGQCWLAFLKATHGMRRVDVTVRRFKGAKHVGMSSVKASASDFYFGLALIRAHWQHALGVTG